MNENQSSGETVEESEMLKEIEHCRERLEFLGSTELKVTSWEFELFSTLRFFIELIDDGRLVLKNPFPPVDPSSFYQAKLEAYENALAWSEAASKEDIFWWLKEKIEGHKANLKSSAPTVEAAPKASVDESDALKIALAKFHRVHFDSTGNCLIAEHDAIYKMAWNEALDYRDSNGATWSNNASSESPQGGFERESKLVQCLNKIDHLIRPHRYSQLPDEVKWEIYHIAADFPRLTAEEEANRLKNTAGSDRAMSAEDKEDLDDIKSRKKEASYSYPYESASQGDVSDSGPKDNIPSGDVAKGQTACRGAIYSPKPFFSGCPECKFDSLSGTIHYPNCPRMIVTENQGDES